MNAAPNQNASTSAAGAMTPGNNLAALLAKLRTDLANLGKTEAAGTGSRAGAAEKLVRAAQDGIIDEAMAGTCYDDYLAPGVKLAAQYSNVSVKTGSYDQQVSKFRQFIKLGMLSSIDGVDLMTRAAAMRAEAENAGTKMKSPFDALLDVARKQLEDATAVLADDQIREIMSRKQAAEKDTLDKLIAAYKANHKLNEQLKLPGTQEAVEALAREITEAGGDVPPVTKAEKEHAAFMVKAATMGFARTPAPRECYLAG